MPNVPVEREEFPADDRGDRNDEDRNREGHREDVPAGIPDEEPDGPGDRYEDRRGDREREGLQVRPIDPTRYVL